MSIYYPEARVQLSVVFEDFKVLEDSGLIDPFTMKPTIFERSIDPSLTNIKRPTVFPVQPQSIQVNSNSYKEADTWSVDFDAKDLPFSPELIKAASCEIYIFGKKGLGSKPSLVATAKGGASGGNPVLGIDGKALEPTIVGLVDNAELNYEEDGRVFSIDGRDYTALFLDKVFVRKNGRPRRLKARGQKLDAVLAGLIKEVDPQNVMTLRVEPEGTPMPAIGAKEGRGNKRGISFPDSANFWEVMTTIAIRYGFIIFVRGLDVVLSKPQSRLSQRPDIRKVAWGRNLTHLSMRRKLGKERVPTIEIRSYDDKRRATIVGKYPKKGVKAVTGLGTVRNEIKQFTVDNIRSKKQLDEIAETTYGLLARAELTVNMETDDLLDLIDPRNPTGTRNSMIEIRAGDAVSIDFDQFNDEVLQKLKSEEERFAFLVSRGFSSQVARVVANNWRALDTLREPMRVREATIDWGNDEGIAISAELIQFVNVSGASAEP